MEEKIHEEMLKRSKGKLLRRLNIFWFKKSMGLRDELKKETDEEILERNKKGKIIRRMNMEKEWSRDERGKPIDDGILEREVEFGRMMRRIY